ncbi:MAG: hypothetical protein E6G68_02175 [Actinobacteria bacterium]|nr:MAG: hypothetical protein E6G68_02175 [Actinomycetota bacterium]
MAIGSVVPAGIAIGHTELDQSQESVNEIFCVQPHVGSACYHGGAQTVTAGESGDLIAVALDLQREAFTTKDLAVEIHAGTPTGALLATSNPVAAGDIPVTPTMGWILFDFPTPPIVTAGDVFAIVIPDQPVYPTSDPRWGWGKNSSDVYAGGAAWGGSGGVWGAYVDGSDMAFETFMTTSPATCDLKLSINGGAPTDGPATVQAGHSYDIIGADFPPLTGVAIQLHVVSGNYTFAAADTTDVLGQFTLTRTTTGNDLSDWLITAHPTSNPPCTDTVLLSVVEAPAASPAPTPAPAPPASALPNTAYGTGPSDQSPAAAWLMVVLVTGLGSAGWLLRTHASRLRRRRRGR